jgi:hypothetical protein
MADVVNGVPYPDIDLAQVRRYVQGRGDSSSVRAVATEIGIGHTSLEKFLDGSSPYAKNRILIVEWYLRENEIRPVREPMPVPADLQVQVAQAQPGSMPGHLDALLSELRGESRTEARVRITTTLTHAYRRMGMEPPRWLFA